MDVEIDSFLQKVDLAGKVKTKISKLSYSEKKRLQLARVILHQPDLLVMEEPDQGLFIALDIQSGGSVWIMLLGVSSAISGL